MKIGKVVGTIISTRKHHKLVGSKLLIVEIYSKNQRAGENQLVAVDTVGAGVGELVLVVEGSSARVSIDTDGAPVDAAIIGIIDEENNIDM
ncbi:MAG: EutN/CcmL family microcompartment protein [Epulopiscium sp.]|nr:EutN/CcmL family microcompartment protein [Candidatus Epulonipiscium sp.]